MSERGVAGLAERWTPRLQELCQRIRHAVRASLTAAITGGKLEDLAREAGQGAGDVTFGLDLPGENAVLAWTREQARAAPLSVLTEERGWMHLGPGPAGSDSADAVSLEGFDHGGPRIAFDPVDGTRQLMADLRSAWTVVSFAGPGTGPPRFADLLVGLVTEIPDSRAATYRSLSASRGAGCVMEERRLADDELILRRPLVADDKLRLDHAYFPFFKFSPDLRPELARIEARFFERLQRLEGADVDHCYDDQYISNAGQLFLLAQGTYRMIADLRASVAARSGRQTTCAKPYDLAGAVLCATEVGCVVTSPSGAPLDFELDTETPVSFVGYANRATRECLEPHLLAGVKLS